MKEFEKAHADPVIEMLRNFMRCCKKVFIHVSARLVGKDSMRNLTMESDNGRHHCC